MFSVLVTLALTMSVVFLVIPSKSLAGSTLALTDLQIIGITSDGNKFVRENIHPYQMAAKKPLNGSEVRIAVYYRFSEQESPHRSQTVFRRGMIVRSNTEYRI